MRVEVVWTDMIHMLQACANVHAYMKACAQYWCDAGYSHFVCMLLHGDGKQCTSCSTCTWASHAAARPLTSTGWLSSSCWWKRRTRTGCQLCAAAAACLQARTW